MIRVCCFGFKGIYNFVDSFFQAIWVVVRRLCLQPLLLVGVCWVCFLALADNAKANSEINLLFAILTGLSFAYAVAATLYNVLIFVKETKSQPKQKKQRIVSVAEITSNQVGEKPSYYRVAQNPQYVMAEYSDRYELYYDDGDKLKFVKVTLKENENKAND